MPDAYFLPDRCSVAYEYTVSRSDMARESDLLDRAGGMFFYMSRNGDGKRASAFWHDAVNQEYKGPRGNREPCNNIGNT